MSEPIFDWTSAISSGLGAASILVAAGFFVSERVRPIALKVDPPAVVELRCSAMNFDADYCASRLHADRSHLSVTSALRFRAVGPSARSVTISSAQVTVRFPDGFPEREELTLDAFWTGDLTGGKGAFAQVVPLSLSGGQAFAQEVWFMPLTAGKTCPPYGDLSLCTGGERRNFVPWQTFIADLVRLSEAAADAGGIPEFNLDYQINWRIGDRAKRPVTFSCRVEVGATVRKMATADWIPPDPEREGAADAVSGEAVYKPLFLTARCL